MVPAAVEEVPEGDYEIPLGRARLAQAGRDITLVGWGQQVRVLELAVRCTGFSGPPVLGGWTACILLQRLASMELQTVANPPGHVR